MTRIVTATDLERAFELGHAAYHRPDAIAAPSADPDLHDMLTGMPVGTGAVDLMRAWSRGWTDAADAAAERVLTPPEPTTPTQPPARVTTTALPLAAAEALAVEHRRDGQDAWLVRVATDRHLAHVYAAPPQPVTRYDHTRQVTA